jgi:hypothetical protein
MPDRISFTDPEDQPLLDELGLNAETVFTDPRIHVWRSLPDRENATLDYVQKDGHAGRLHLKRYPPAAGAMARRELAGFFLLTGSKIPAAPVIAAGSRADGSSFIILRDLEGYRPADKLLQRGFPFDRLLNATADLAAQLHNARLHHRDLYLCHFMISSRNAAAATAGSPDHKSSDSGVAATAAVDAKLIDMARVARMSCIFTRRRWIVKDLAQFWYSTLSLPVTDEQRKQWLDRYCAARRISPPRWVRAIQCKAAAIGRHDVELQKKQPGRNVSIGSIA